MPRSGTSALTRVLSLGGCSLPNSVFGATTMNPTGYWEPVEATKLNVEFTTRHGLSDGDPAIDPLEVTIGEHGRNDFIEKVAQLLAATRQSAPMVIKEFRVHQLLPLWLEAAPQEVFQSNIAFSQAQKSLRLPGPGKLPQMRREDPSSRVSVPSGLKLTC
jgi:hypothetical protein